MQMTLSQSISHQIWVDLGVGAEATIAETQNVRAEPFLARDRMLSVLYAIANPSVCLSVTRVDQSKTVEVRIMQFSPYSSSIPLLFAV